MQHVIKKQIISLQLEESLDSFRLQQQISDYFWREMLPLLEKEFDRISVEGEVVSLDRVEIDLGVILKDEVNTMVWDTNIISQLRKEIEALETEQLITTAEPGIRLARSDSSFQAWLFYMQQGFLPWNVLSTDETWYEQVLDELVDNQHRINRLQQAMFTNEVMLLRIVRQHPLSFLLELVEILRAEKHAELFKEVEEIYAQIIVPGGANPKKAGIKYSEQRSAAMRAIYESTIREMLTSASSSTAGLASLAPAMLQSLKQKWNAVKDLKEPTSSTGKPAAEIRPPSFQNLQKMPVSSTEADIIEADVYMEQLKDDGIYVDGIGLVLVHLFIPALLELVGFTNNKQFIDLRAQERAVYLLHYVTTGKKDAEEHELLIPKLLCAFDPSLPINIGVKLLKWHYKEADHMLKAAIAAWGILKKTSPDGLREGFLKRKGKVYLGNERIHFLVEKSGIDVLLDQLPWTLSILKYPWLKDFIKIEWR